MDKRIKELVEQAGATIHKAMHGQAISFLENDLERFAELVRQDERELAKPEQEPQMIQIKDGQLSYIKKPWVGLTDDEVYEIANFCKDQPFNLYAKEIESKLRSKNAV